MLKGLEGNAIARYHDLALACGKPQESAQSPSSPWHWIEANHRYNTLLWQEEDKARRIDVGPEAIATSKRLIDQYNQRRNDAVEALDEIILSILGNVPRFDNARLNSETAGAMIDRLSILALKVYHMRAQTERSDADAAHIGSCRAKLTRLAEQRQDLIGCLDQLLADAEQGRAYFKVYRQFKMYNDPTLNPYLYRQNQPRHTERASS
ncbi:acriflavin resistance protein [Novimethylophilus kurashikiensis]|uniref:Acriflavin resistance protein n=1 Tax=Novimethylophilus kurashikiensis TaxID=1825523 RepID=A0A2R5F1P2_9PROT|nr:DUF4254 domain-containing protein [Novimethylophilus kurashikiensis]GBG12602.1 acriflavin resistance protein [Novimethylophilus kurashikiensis]